MTSEELTIGQCIDLHLRREYPTNIYGANPDYLTMHLVRQVCWLLDWSIMVWKNRLCRQVGLNRRELRHAIKAEAKRPGEDRKMAGFRYDQYDETMAAFNKVHRALVELCALLKRYPQ